MKVFKKFLLIGIVPYVLAAQPFSRGVTFSNWFQPESINRLPFSKYSKKDFENVKLLGCDVIRLPINLHAMTDGTSEQKIDERLFYFLDQVIDWAEEVNMNLILDNHSFNPSIDTDYRIDTILIPVWQQVAERYKNRTNLIYYEILNEPHGISHSRWNQIQQNVIDAIRQIDSVHTIIVGSADWNGFYGLEQLPQFADTNLLYTFHFYNPHLFTHQGARWTIPSMENVAGIPFPYSASEMPPLDPSYSGTWIEEAYNNYPTEGTETNVKSLIDIAVDFKNSRNVDLFCGEFGVYMKNSNNNHRINWYTLVRNYLEQNDIPWIAWDYKEGFGLFEKGSDELFEHDLNLPLINALGLNTVPQSEYVRLPDSSQILIYSDMVEEFISETSYSLSESMDFYSVENPAEGNFCMFWNGGNQYDYLGFDFIPDRDFSFLKNNGFVFSFWLKGLSDDTEFNLRFVDTKEENIPGDHPWRMVYKIDNSIVDFDGKWHKIEIPLQHFWEQGSWDNGWFEPEGKFDWTAIDEFNIVAEYKNITGSQLWFDELKIYNPDFVSVADNQVPAEFKLYQNYPNPFNPSTTIEYVIPSNIGGGIINVKLTVYDVLGREVATLVNEKQTPGNYKVIFEANFAEGGLPSGIYLYKLQAGHFIQTRKMILMK